MDDVVQRALTGHETLEMQRHCSSMGVDENRAVDLSGEPQHGSLALAAHDADALCAIHEAAWT